MNTPEIEKKMVRALETMRIRAKAAIDNAISDVLAEEKLDALRAKLEPEFEFGENDVDPPTWKRVHRDPGNGRAAKTSRVKVEARKLTDADLDRIDKEADEWRAAVTEGTKDLETMSEPSEQLMHDKTDEYESRDTAPDKRVPAELWKYAIHLLREWNQGDVSRQLEACPDITDAPVDIDPYRPTECDGCGEPAVYVFLDSYAGARIDYCKACWTKQTQPATLHPTAQAVLDEVETEPYAMSSAALRTARHKWLEAGRPMVVRAKCQCTHEAGDSECPIHVSCSDCGACGHGCQEQRFLSPEDAATLQALRRCRELGVYHMWSGARWCVWSNGTGTFHAEDIPEALAAYEAAQRPL